MAGNLSGGEKFMKFQRRLTTALIIILLLMVECNKDRGLKSRSSDTQNKIPIKEIKVSITAFKNESEYLSLGDPSYFKEYIKRELEGSPLFYFVSEGDEPYKRGVLRVKAVIAPDRSKGQLVAYIELNLYSNTVLPLKLNFEVNSNLDIGKEPTKEMAWSLLERGLKNGIEELIRQAKIVTSSEEELFKALESGEIDTKIAAIYILGEKKVKKALEPICKIMKESPSPPLWDACLGAFAQLKEESTVPCILQSIGDDDSKLFKAMEVLSIIGGKDAKSYLEMVSEGHDNPLIKEFASKLLKEIDSKIKK